jgi:5-methylcytosine-specific restriction endonuclease McrA
MASQIISRRAALAQGLTRYFSGETCPQGHVAERFVTSYACVACTISRADERRSSVRATKRAARPKPKQPNRVISRKDAQTQGLVRYFTGYPCKRSHLAERLVSDKACMMCMRLRKSGPDYAAKLRARYARNPDKYKAMVTAYTEANRAKVRERRRKHREANKERLYAETRAWAKANPRKRRVGERNREARERGAIGTHTFADIQDIGRMQEWRCANQLCRVPVETGCHIDHIVPIALGGTNDRRNIQLLCAPCNQSKHALDPIEWAQTQGLLL